MCHFPCGVKQFSTMDLPSRTLLTRFNEASGEIRRAEATRARGRAEADRRTETAEAQERDLNLEALELEQKAREAESKAGALDPKETR